MIEDKSVKIGIIAFLVLFLGIMGYFVYSNYIKASNPEMEKPTYSTIVQLETNKGTIKIGLYDESYPITTQNFKDLVNQGFYNNLTFHRVIPGFMIQGGDPVGDGTGGPGYTIEDEFHGYNKNNRGTIAMANSGPNSGGSQFFINVADNNYLDTKHPVFGEVIEGMDVVDAIASVTTDENDKPLEDVVITTATIVTQ